MRFQNHFLGAIVSWKHSMQHPVYGSEHLYTIPKVIVTVKCMRTIAKYYQCSLPPLFLCISIEKRAAVRMQYGYLIKSGQKFQASYSVPRSKQDALHTLCNQKNNLHDGSGVYASGETVLATL